MTNLELAFNWLAEAEIDGLGDITRDDLVGLLEQLQ
jgi:hypothetical protein